MGRTEVSTKYLLSTKLVLSASACKYTASISVPSIYRQYQYLRVRTRWVSYQTRCQYASMREHQLTRFQNIVVFSCAHSNEGTQSHKHQLTVITCLAFWHEGSSTHNDGLFSDCQWHHEAAVVVRVLADEVDASWSENHSAAIRRPEARFEQLGGDAREFLGRRPVHDVCCSDLVRRTSMLEIDARDSDSSDTTATCGPCP